jgi:hypothetical protein
VIPNNVEILGWRCFFYCKSLSSITFESSSRLTRIESEAFYGSSLQSILIPSNVEILGSHCFSFCESLSSITFESNSHLTRIESCAFIFSSLQSILIPKSVEILGSCCFSYCKSLSSITFESNSRLIRIESSAFTYSSLESIIIPSTILFVASDAVYPELQISLLDVNSCSEFDRWLYLRISGIDLDFRRIVRVNSGLEPLRNYEMNLSVFEERSMICQSEEVLKEIYCRCEDECLIVVKSISLSEFVERSQLEKELENLINLRHPCIAAPIGFVFPAESEISRELKIIELHGDGNSLSEVISTNPEWWTATVKAKAVVGLVLGLRFLHSLGFLHGSLNSNNIIFDVNHHIEMADFGWLHQSVGENKMGGFSSARWTRQTDVREFALILFEIVFGLPMMGEVSISTDIPELVSWIMKAGLCSEFEKQPSFCNIFQILKQNDFQIMEGVDSAEVLAFANWVESAEDPNK